MSIYTMAFAGLSPIGSVFAGTVAHWLRASLTFAVGGLICGIVFLAVIAKGKKGTVRSKV
jgi:hypothetical protein